MVSTRFAHCVRSQVIGMIAVIASLSSGCSPEGTGSVQVPAAKARRETARTGALPDPNTGAATVRSADLSRTGPARTDLHRSSRSR
jgi:hypothetical protein